MDKIQINFERLRRDIEELGEIGRREDRGIYRMALTEEDRKARAWLRQRIEEAGLEFFEDGALNLHAKYGGKAGNPSIVMGSHLDTVPGGGPLDGSLGILVGLECLRTLSEGNFESEFPLELIAFTDEEGRFGGMFGSQAFTGELTPETIHRAVDLDGIRLIDILSQMGRGPMEAMEARRTQDTVRCYLELHIEQGPVLDRLGYQAGVVEGIVGLRRWQVRLIGESNHAGTTPMNMRHDAFQGVAELSGEIQRILEEDGSEHSVATIGRVELFPGSANTIPGRAEFSLEFRDTDRSVLENLGDAFRRTLSSLARRRGLKFEFDVISQIEPVLCDSGLVELIESRAKNLDIRHLRMPSGAAHDAQIVAHIAPVSMIFVPSKGGVSHSPYEWTAFEDIEAGANLALQSLIAFTGEAEPHRWNAKDKRK